MGLSDTCACGSTAQGAQPQHVHDEGSIWLQSAGGLLPSAYAMVRQVDVKNDAWGSMLEVWCSHLWVNAVLRHGLTGGVKHGVRAGGGCTPQRALVLRRAEQRFIEAIVHLRP